MDAWIAFVNLRDLRTEDHPISPKITGAEDRENLKLSSAK
jgi:hypothetical protein